MIFYKKKHPQIIYYCNFESVCIPTCLGYSKNDSSFALINFEFKYYSQNGISQKLVHRIVWFRLISHFPLQLKMSCYLIKELIIGIISQRALYVECLISFLFQSAELNWNFITYMKCVAQENAFSQIIRLNTKTVDNTSIYFRH